ncbi:hypothetical protein GCM10011400_13890 [Paraburkholderia caffeinilytica]|uniref:Uncharacterized protein n=1 Tax=Paraburkholderia caffeinilytica TaxID=1761016 RepID=A0ABQ1LQP0_9BURK|nr:hypothetical protein GCM10011400_13890 [Paraburkholderia caffeinilytica]
MIADDGFGETIQRGKRRGETLADNGVSGIQQTRRLETAECGFVFAASGAGVAFGAPFRCGRRLWIVLH